ncbi:putative short-chain dehydrogenase [Actinoplanes missouriensis 431]|uniref:Putative short-chain dehydrogenase n=1 Tax=Actinoplanes missouriensis (strain ATCC 14538 / DSM 43046 / CBS 188.64 / JCM 3121 / NBRC 102363 / NCIMB 12654 / NRRL B-3342 / UNCC 431) TaxID=512565 RepID=I0HD63_ACTM4|nr:SDR family oxidoreductase [Actinoplanes missouriensis]BAL90950.1 putative short-chain dehydrogenase [Actinoplanes missouriensis 431]
MTVVVVTGGTRGIGQGLVRSFLALGAQVAYCGRSAPVDGPSEALFVTADVTRRGDVRSLWDATVDKYGKVDIWVNNAGLSNSRKPLWQLDPAEIDAVVDVNLRGTLQAGAVVLDAMLAQGHGALWNMEGLGSNGQIVAGLTPYGSTKRGLTYATLAMAKELTGTPVKVGLLSPGMVVTDLLTRDYEPAELEKAKKIFNILADRVETVTPWLARRVLAGTRNGGRVAWLTRRKAAYRFATAAFTRRDLFGDS